MSMNFQIGDLVTYRNSLLSDTSKYVGYISRTANNGYDDIACVEWISHKIPELPDGFTGFVCMSKLEKA